MVKTSKSYYTAADGEGRRKAGERLRLARPVLLRSRPPCDSNAGAADSSIARHFPKTPTLFPHPPLVLLLPPPLTPEPPLSPTTSAPLPPSPFRGALSRSSSLAMSSFPIDATPD